MFPGNLQRLNILTDGPAEVKATMRSGDRTQDSHTSTSVQAQILLTTLRNMIIPLFNAAIPNLRDINQVPLGTEADEFLSALEKYISCIIRDRSKSDDKSEVMVSLDESSGKTAGDNNDSPYVINLPDTLDVEVHDVVSYGAAVSPYVLTPIENPIYSGTWPNLQATQLQNSGPGLLDQALTELRTHVFDKMPIRLLCFEQIGPKLSITLLDKEGIFSHLSSKLRARVRESGFTVINSLAVNRLVSTTAVYGILSHTWLHGEPGEITYSAWCKGAFDSNQPGYEKLANFCKVAATNHGLSLGWMDTICINKESSAELDESIRSMYKWYLNANVCITYLAGTSTLRDIHKDPWFTRGWTLQELFAPYYTKFYGRNWQQLAEGSYKDQDNVQIQEQIRQATSITPSELRYGCLSMPISRRMQLAAKRKVTRGEDTAYSLMGILEVDISIAYGEGAKKAFFRLVKEILGSTKFNVLDVFNWGGSEYENTTFPLLPTSPEAYTQRSTIQTLYLGEPTKPLSITHLGLRIPVLLCPAVPFDSNPLTPCIPKGDYFAWSVDIKHSGSRPVPSHYNVLDANGTGWQQFAAALDGHRVSFAVLNSGGHSSVDISIPKACLAVVILHNEDPESDTFLPLTHKQKLPTKEPVVFRLDKKGDPDTEGLGCYQIELKELKRHGMRKLYMYI